MNQRPAAELLTFEERESHERGFGLHFQHHILEHLLRIETDRFAALRQRRIRGITTAVIAIGGAVGLYFFYGWRWDYYAPAIAVWLIAVALGLWLTRRPARSYAALRRGILVPEVLRFFGTFTYDPDGRIDRRRLAELPLFDDRDRYDGEDLITGTHDDRPFEFAEATFRRKERKKTRTMFRGQVLILGLAHKAEGTTIGLHQIGGLPNDADETAARGRGLARVPDDESATAGFEIYGTHDDEARRLVDDRLKEAVAQIAAMQDATNVEFGVKGSTFLLKMATGLDLFTAAPLGRTALETEDTRRLLREVALVLAVIDAVARATAS